MKRNKLTILNIIPSLFNIIFQLLTFTIKSERWLKIASGVLIWINILLIGYGLLSIFNIL